jgi:tRNA dimethylallyltransferase
MREPFFIVGPTAVGKSEMAAAVARQCGAEIVGADAFQLYAGLNLLTAKPEPELLAAVPHHLVGVVPLTSNMDAEQFRLLACEAIAHIHARGKRALVVGGSGLYVKALTHGLSTLPRADEKLRGELNVLSAPELGARLEELDPAAAQTIDRHNKRRLVRALEICLLTGRPVSAQRQQSAAATSPAGVLVYRDRAELYARINSRVEAIFANGVVEEVRAAGPIGPTAAQTLGLHEIQELLAGRISEAEAIAHIQHRTRRYAKRQLTWFQRQTIFEPLNLSPLGPSEAIEWITRKARLSFPRQHD